MQPAKQLDKIGAAGAIFTALCCLGVSVVVSLAASLGLGFLINDAILMPLLIVFLLIDWSGLFVGRRRHGHLSPLITGLAAGGALLLFAFLFPVKPVAYLAIAGLIAASVMNAAFARQHRQGVPS